MLSHSYDMEGVESSTILILITLSLATCPDFDNDEIDYIEQYIYSNATSDKIEKRLIYSNQFLKYSQRK